MLRVCVLAINKSQEVVNGEFITIRTAHELVLTPRFIGSKKAVRLLELKLLCHTVLEVQ